MRWRGVVIVAVAAALGTVLLDWWTVPVVGAVWGLLAHRRGRPERAAFLGATLGWAALLVWNMVVGDGWLVATRLGGVFGLGGVGFVALTLGFGGVLAGSAAAVVASGKRLLR